MLRKLLPIALLMTLTGCENFQSSSDNQSNYRLATPPQPKSTQFYQSPKVVSVNKKQLMHTSRNVTVVQGTNAVDQANRNATIKPTSASAMNSIIIFPYQAGDLYQIYTTPLNITDVQLQAGEQIISVAAGDTVRWEISKTVSGGDASRTEHLLIKPTAENLDTTLVITTNMRTYHILLKSTPNTFMATVQWQYDDDGMMMSGLADNTNGMPGSNGNPAALSFNVEQLDFAYKTESTRGPVPDWMPKAVFNDGYKTYIEFPERIQSAPALFIKQSGSGDAAVNYRVVGNYYVIDQVITGAELVTKNNNISANDTVVTITKK